MADFPEILPLTLVHEGLYSDHPEDPGGATMKGITQRTYNAWRKASGLPPAPVRGISDEEVEAIYKRDYWLAASCDRMPAGVNYAVFDFAVNSGVSRAVRYLQKVIGAKQDGVYGSNTHAALMAADPQRVIADLCNARMKFLRGLKHWKTFKRGWTRRVMGDHDGVQAADIGVIDRATAMARRVAYSAPAVPDASEIAKGDGEENAAKKIGDAFTVKNITALLGASGGSIAAVSELDGPVAYAAAFAVCVAVLAAVAMLWRSSK